MPTSTHDSQSSPSSKCISNDADDDSMVEFYEQLQQEAEATPRHDVRDCDDCDVMNLNAKIGEDNEGCEKVKGQHELGRMNEIGERLPMFNVATMTW